MGSSARRSVRAASSISSRLNPAARSSSKKAGSRSCTARLELEERARHAARAEQSGADMRADDGADLGDPDRLAAEDLAPAFDEPLGLLSGLDVLDDPAVRAVGLAGLHVVDEALEGAARGAHALDGDDLGLQREDRLDLQRGAEHRLRLADAPAALEELERVDGEQDLQALARGAGGGDDLVGRGARAGGAGGGEDHEPQTAGGRLGVEDLDAAAGLLRRLARGLDRARDAAGAMDGDDVAAFGDERLVDREEVTD